MFSGHITSSNSNYPGPSALKHLSGGRTESFPSSFRNTNQESDKCVVSCSACRVCVYH